MRNADADDVTEGLQVFGSDGTSLGIVDRVYRDNDTGRPEWAVVGSRFLPLRDVTYDVDGLRVGYSRDQVDGAPEADPDAGFLTRAQEADLYLHYGIDYDVTTLIQHQTGGERGGASGEDLGEDPPAADRDAAAADPDHLVRTGVLDSGVVARDQRDGQRSGGEQVFGTGSGGTLMGTAGTRRAAGTAATTPLDERDDLTTSDGESSSEDGDPSGSALSDVAPDQR